MTNAEAIEEIKSRISTTEYVGGSYVDCVDLEALKLAIKALEAQELNCDGCVYQEVADRSVLKPFVDPCIWCKRNCIDHWKGKK